MDAVHAIVESSLLPLWAWIRATPIHLLVVSALGTVSTGLLLLFFTLHLVAPKPRPVLPSEKTYITSSPTEPIATGPRQLPCWYDRWLAERHASEKQTDPDSSTSNAPVGGDIEPAELRLSVVFPAYNEEERIIPTLEEAVAYLDEHIGRPTDKTAAAAEAAAAAAATEAKKQQKNKKQRQHHHHHDGAAWQNHVYEASGYEIIIVNDGSTDNTVGVALDFARDKGLHDVLRIVTLETNRGKGGGVTHGLRHARGQYVLFADADGASRFCDVNKLIEGCDEVADGSHRGVAIGSRAHLVGSDAVVKRSALRNFLMRSFHLVLTILTPPATSRIRDTQCGFKLFTRAALPHIVPYMHAEGWIFDIEMLMLAESAPATPILGSDGSVIGTSPGIKVVEVPIEWHEVGGSKLNVVRDSVAMALGLAILRASWMMGVYRRRLT
ncbi:dolichyl-phosphate beta-glucosyltransferase [Geosmithia morbida]|uniref:dolichyl-phosphate beta-glucosyltransferase n=1 Tax=Geosmithia morbida TaxID=1094350 RepID=A0A9P5D3T4_9HYPO|nr:dolichyl-phosphate beta-glucosyltransferase [Geosmithia morbida]KAF4126558.1 dolichyl-phosphate beta-glucosyltransferase [Geosmithia morbida]